jgi:hypothetical protein
MSKFVGTGPSSYKKKIYGAAVSQRLRNTALESEHVSLNTTNEGALTIYTHLITLVCSLCSQQYIAVIKCCREVCR